MADETPRGAQVAAGEGVRKGAERTSPRWMTPSALVASLLVGGLLTLFLYWLLPRWEARELLQVGKVRLFPEYSALEKSLRDQLAPAQRANVRVEVRDAGYHVITPLVLVEFVLKAEHRDGVVSVGLDQARFRLRWDRLIGALAFIFASFVASVALQVLGRKMRQPPALLEAALAGTEDPLEKVLIAEVDRLELRCHLLDRRSQLMFWSGVLVAMAGLGAIYFLTSPDFLSSGAQRTRVSSDEVVGLVKSFAVLAYVEGIAFFLLRFHRHGIADYKYYNALRGREVRILEALRAFRAAPPLGDERETLLVSALLNEDQFRGFPSSAKTASGEAVTGSQLERAMTVVEKLAGRKGS